MATTKKTTKPKAKGGSKAKPKSSSIGSTLKTAVKSAVIPGYGAFTAAKKLDDYIQKKDPSLSKSKTYKALKEPAKKAKSAMDYIGDKAISFGKGAAAVISNPGKYIEKGASKIGKAAYSGLKAVDDYIEKVDPNLSKSKVYGALKGKAKKVPKDIETNVGLVGKAVAMSNPLTGSLVAGREVGKVAKKGAKAADDYIQKNDPYLSKSKTYGAVKGAAKSVLGGKSGSTAKKASTSKKDSAKKPMAVDGAKQAMALRDAEKKRKEAANAKNNKSSATTTTTTKSAPTVSELWKQKTGTSWSEAKKLGLSDGSASSNIALMKKLQSGSVNKNTVKSSKAAGDMTAYKKDMAQNVQDELSGKTTYAPPAEPSKSGADKAADENKMRRGGMVRRRMGAGGPTPKGARLNPIGRKIAMTALGVDKKNSMVSKQYKTGGMVKKQNKKGGIINLVDIIPTPGKYIERTAKKIGTAAGKKMRPKALEAARALKKTYRAKLKSVDDKIEKRYPNYTGKGSTYQAVKDIAKKYLKTGGMVNSNSKVSASKVARGRVGGTSTAPRTAVPKAMYGMSMKPGMMRKGGTKKR